MIKVIFSLIFASILFSGCGSKDSTSTVVNNSDGWFTTKYNTYYRYDYLQTDYETDTEYQLRLNTYIASVGNIIYELPLKDSYDITTGTLTVYYDNYCILKSIYPSSVGFEHSLTLENSVYYDNILNVFNLLSDFSLIIDSNNDVVFYQANVSASEAEALNGRFYLSMNTTLVKSPYAFARYSDFYLGKHRQINVNALSFTLKNSSTELNYISY